MAALAWLNTMTSDDFRVSAVNIKFVCPSGEIAGTAKGVPDKAHGTGGARPPATFGLCLYTGHGAFAGGLYNPFTPPIQS